MKWVVLGESDGKIKLTSKGGIKNAILPKGSYLTAENNGNKFILRVDDSRQVEPYSPSPLIADMDLSGLIADRQCKNEITAYRIKDESEREDGMIDFIPPLTEARRSSQEEVDLALGTDQKGPKVFIATVQSNQNRILKDENGKHITASLPEDMFFHQMLICGKTGSGKTVAMKYLAQYFAEVMEGAVLAVNVKDVDFLMMDKSSSLDNDKIKSEWETLGAYPHGVSNLTMYMPANRDFKNIKGINADLCKKITLSVDEIDPESLVGLLQGISDRGAMSLPGIFRSWRQYKKKDYQIFSDFVNYFNTMGEIKEFPTLNERGDESSIKLHSGTYENMRRSLDVAQEFFDNKNSINLGYKDILQNGKMSILDFSGDKGPKFGSILLRDLLKKIVDAKDSLLSKVPILIIIDEVHQFYGSDSTKEALSDLDTICRTGRSKKIGIIFASQSFSDIPSGLSSVINTQISFKTDSMTLKNIGVKATQDEMEGLEVGFAFASIHGLPQLKILKFPLSYAGVVKNE
jgi:Cdc6-like AAA superfamily ATPase